MNKTQRRIIELACAFAEANDRGDAASDALADLPDDQDDAESAGLMQAAEAADEDYNRTKAELFALCRQYEGRELHAMPTQENP